MGAPAGANDAIVVNLPRGGIWVRTAAGPIQFGMPPETIKDSMSLDLDVPTIFVVPKVMFDRQRGVNTAEIEFPAYYNYFILKRRIRLVVGTAAAEDALRTILEQSLFGPAESRTDEEFRADYPADGRPDFKKECEYFRRGPRGRLVVDELVEFLQLGPGETLALGEGVALEHSAEGGHYVRQNGHTLAQVGDRVKLPPGPDGFMEASTIPFNPPSFGISVLGSSHGFDPHGRTTGFVLWVGHRGILVDPPVDATEDLKGKVATKVVDSVILTHCHADHDAGTFQKILEEGRITLFTTPTILGSFLRKYSSLSGISEDMLRRTFSFHPIKIGEPIPVHGGELRFFYTLHSIPTIGFEVLYGGKSLAFSSDTLYDPEKVQEMHRQGVVGTKRAQDLMGFPWYDDLVVHEAGVPPLHTPMKVLADLPKDVKDRLWLVHTTEEAVPEGSGLRVAREGLYNTLRLQVAEPQHSEATAILEAFCMVDLFRDFPIGRATEVLRFAKLERYAKKTRIIQQGTPGRTFYVIVSGIAAVVQDNAEIKTYNTGDYFGETALVLEEPRNADVVAKTNVVLLAFDRRDFLYLVRNTSILQRLTHLARIRAERSWEVMEKNSVLRAMTSAQKTMMQSLLDEARPIRAGQTLWLTGRPAEAAWLVDEGRVSLNTGETDGDAPTFGSGAFLGETDALRRRTAHGSTCEVLENGRAFRLEATNLQRFFQDNPGLLVSFLGTRFVE
jgi:CRP-like cAMP-binding protein